MYLLTHALHKQLIFAVTKEKERGEVALAREKEERVKESQMWQKGVRWTKFPAAVR